MPFASDIGSDGTAMLGGSIGVPMRTPRCARIGSAISSASATIFFLCLAKTLPLSTTELVQRAHHGSDDPRRIFHAVEMRDTRWRVAHLDRDLDERHALRDRAEEHLRFESVPIGARAELERGAHRIAAEAAL